MSYIDRFLAKFSDVSPRSTDTTYKSRAQETRQSNGQALTRPTTASPVSPVSRSGDEPSKLVPPWPPRPAQLVTWPVPLRQRWGELANALENQGVPFPDSERRAFAQVRSEEEENRRRSIAPR
jgi:hypothetical protein